MGARLGAKAIIVGKVGDDEHGKAYMENLRQQNVDLTHLGVEKVDLSWWQNIIVNMRSYREYPQA